LLLLRREVAVEQTGRLLFGTRHEVPVDIEGDLDRAMAHEGAERLRVHAGVDHQARRGVAAVVEGESLEARLLPSLVGSLLH
jgi:hypothetical protein